VKEKDTQGVKNAMISTPETLSASLSFIPSTSQKAFPGLGFDIMHNRTVNFGWKFENK